MLKESFVLKENIEHKDELKDEELLIRNSQADPEAFRPLYEKYFKRIFLFVHRRVGNKALTADIASQVFLKRC
jgi:RNA polymerase sigma-70 factor (ECF subfamily)